MAFPFHSVLWLIRQPKLLKQPKRYRKKTGSDRWAVKAQIHAGGRGKGGGVKIAKSLEEVEQFSDQILGMMLVTPQTSAEGKRYVACLSNKIFIIPARPKWKSIMWVFCLTGLLAVIWLCIRLAAEWTLKKWLRKHLSWFFHEEIDPKVGLQAFQARQIAFNLGLSGTSFKEMQKFIRALYNAYEAVTPVCLKSIRW